MIQRTVLRSKNVPEVEHVKPDTLIRILEEIARIEEVNWGGRGAFVNAAERISKVWDDAEKYLGIKGVEFSCPHSHLNRRIVFGNLELMKAYVKGRNVRKRTAQFRVNFILPAKIEKKG